MTEEWIRVAAEQDLKEGVPVSVELEEEKNVLLVRRGSTVHACGAACTHYGAPLADGHLSGNIITCPWHNARFDIESGRLLSPPALNNLPSYEAKIESGAVYVRARGSNVVPMPEGKDGRTFVILGAGAAGNAAAEGLRRFGYAGRILMITRENHRPYDRTMLSKGFLSGEAPAKWLPLHGEKYYQRLQIEVETGRNVQSLDPASRTLTFTDGSGMTADKLLLATGGETRTLDIPGAEMTGCFLLRSLADSEAIVAACEQAHRAVVLGASFIGLEVAASLRHRDIEVHVVAPETLPLGHVFGEQVGRFLQSLHERNGVHFHLGQTAAGIQGDGRVRRVDLADGSAIDTDLVVIGVGIRPAVGYLEGSGLLDNGALPVNGRLETPAEGIYAAGDIAVVPDGRSGRPRRVEHWVEAERQGMHAARVMAGSSEPYREVPFFWTRQFGNSLKYVGHAPEWEQVVVRGRIDDGEFLAGYYGGGSLRAVAGIGKAREFIVLGQLLERGEGLTAEELGDESFELLNAGQDQQEAG